MRRILRVDNTCTGTFISPCVRKLNSSSWRADSPFRDLTLIPPTLCLILFMIEVLSTSVQFSSCVRKLTVSSRDLTLVCMTQTVPVIANYLKVFQSFLSVCPLCEKGEWQYRESGEGFDTHMTKTVPVIAYY